jgi:hypothetical protein
LGQGSKNRKKQQRKFYQIRWTLTLPVTSRPETRINIRAPNKKKIDGHEDLKISAEKSTGIQPSPALQIPKVREWIVAGSRCQSNQKPFSQQFGDGFPT